MRPARGSRPAGRRAVPAVHGPGGRLGVRARARPGTAPPRRVGGRVRAGARAVAPGGARGVARDVRRARNRGRGLRARPRARHGVRGVRRRRRALRRRALRGDGRGARRLQRGNPRRAARLRCVSGERSASVAATRVPNRAGCPLRLRQGGDPAGGAPAGRTFRRNTKRFEPRTRRRVRRGGVEPPRGQRGRRAGRAAPRRVLSRSGRAPGCAAVRLRVLGRWRVRRERRRLRGRRRRGRRTREDLDVRVPREQNRRVLPKRPDAAPGGRRAD